MVACVRHSKVELAQRLIDMIMFPILSRIEFNSISNLIKRNCVYIFMFILEPNGIPFVSKTNMRLV